jgi:hypothetical protein
MSSPPGPRRRPAPSQVPLAGVDVVPWALASASLNEAPVFVPVAAAG